MNKGLLIDKFYDKGYMLSALGFNEIAFNYDTTLQIIQWCQNNNYVILGGDVYKYDRDKIVPTSDSWYYETNDSLDSSKEAIKYIEYYNRHHKNCIYSLVIDENEKRL